MSGSYGVLIDMGFSIAVRDAVERDSAVAAVTGAAYPQLRRAGDDVCAFRVDDKYHLILAGPPCQPWSMAPSNPKGFSDARAVPFAKVCKIVNEAMDQDPDTAFMVENVVVHRKLKGEAQMQSDMLGATFTRTTPTRLGFPRRGRARLQRMCVM